MMGARQQRRYTPLSAILPLVMLSKLPRMRLAGGLQALAGLAAVLRGLASKVGYLQRLGMTALWISPVFKQVRYQDTYHGYGIQNFLDLIPISAPEAT